MKTISQLILSVLLLTTLTGCVTVLDATTDQPIEPDPGKRTFGTYIDDEKLEDIIAVNLRKTDSSLEAGHINVFCFNGVVLLTGEVPTKAARQLAGETARGISKIRQVHNELRVQSNSTFFSRTNDNWIASKVRSKVLLADIESDRVKVIVENRVVYLMGLLTREEAQAVSEMAAEVTGVEKVVRVFEYIDR